MAINTRVSIIGCGRIGFSLENDPLRYKPCTHVGAIQTLINQKNTLEWDYLSDLDPEKIIETEKFIRANSHGKNLHRPIRKTTDYRDVLNSRPDILIISAHTNVHYKIATDAIKSGISKIVLEKPVTLSSNQAKRILKLAQKMNTHIWINYERRYHAKYIDLKNTIEQGKQYGAPLNYRGWFASSNNALFKSGPENEGALLHDTTHLIDLVLFLFGDVTRWHNKTMSNHVHQIDFSHHQGITGEILTTTRSKFFHFELEIFFEQGRIKVGNGFTIIEKSEKSKFYKNFTSLGSPLIIADKKMQVKNNPFVNLYKRVINDEYDTSFLKDACQNIKYLT